MARGRVTMCCPRRTHASDRRGEEGDTSGLVERIGAWFREWKSQSLEESLVDASGAWSRRLRRIARRRSVRVPRLGRCADCDDTWN